MIEMGLKDISIDEVLYNKIKELAHKRGLSIRAFTEDIINAYITGDQGDTKSVSEWKQIVVKFPTRCIYCGREIKKGETAYWAKGVGVAHIGCVMEHMLNNAGDKTLAKKYLKIKELEHVIKGLKARADELANVVISKEVVSELNIASKRLVELSNNFFKFMSEYGGSEEDQKRVEEIYNEVIEIRKMVKGIIHKLSMVEKHKLPKVVLE